MDRQAVVGATGCRLALGGLGALRRGDDGGACGGGGGAVVVVEQDGLERLAHVPFDVVGEHAEEARGRARGGAVRWIDRADLEIDGLEAAEGALDLAKAFVGADRSRAVERRPSARWCGSHRMPSRRASASIVLVLAAIGETRRR